jgi:hypothetical protein
VTILMALALMAVGAGAGQSLADSVCSKNSAFALTPTVWRHTVPRWVVLSAFAVGTTLGALLSATVLWLSSGLLAPIPAPVRYALFGLALLAFVLRWRGWISFPVPENRRQIPQDLFTRHPVRAAGQFGFELGTGVRTYVTSTIAYVPVLWILLLQPPYLGAVALSLGFGFARGVLPAAYEVRRRRTADRPHSSSSLAASSRSSPI